VPGSTQPFGGGLGSGEVGDAPGRTGKPGDLGGPHRRPHFVAEVGLRSQHVGRAASIAIMSRHGMWHAAIVPSRHDNRRGGFRVILL
jgi:hypothetical protein